MNMCKAFAENGNDVYLIVPNRRVPELKSENDFAFYGIKPCFQIERIAVPAVKGQSLLYGFKAALRTARLKPDIVYGRNVIGCSIASFLGIPTTFESHSPIMESGFVSRVLFATMIRSRNFKRLVVISDALRRHYSEHYHSISDTVVAHDGADPPYQKMSQECTHASGKLQVGYIGSLYKGRGLDLIISLAQKCPWCDFHVIGGSNVDLQKGELKDHIDNLTFHGQLPPRSVEIFRANFDILLAPYQREIATHAGNNTVQWMSPLKIFEYMSAGKAIVCSNLPVLHEILKQGETVVFCDPDKVEDWHKALVTLRDDRELRQRLGANAQAEFLAKYTWGKRAESVLHYSNVDDLTEATIK